jgi:four helix bundle protein
MPHNPSRLEVVQRADDLVVQIHAFAGRHRRMLAELSPGLRNQLVRAAASVSLNLAEACGYHTPHRAVSFLDIAIGSCNEVERVVRLCSRIGIRDAAFASLLENVASVRAMTYGFRRRIERVHSGAHGPPTSEPDRTSHFGTPGPQTSETHQFDPDI